MAGAKENPCRKFQANIFNKSKCQNCFKPRELHLLTDQDLNQVRGLLPHQPPPVYVCVCAPERGACEGRLSSGGSPASDTASGGLSEMRW
uniref:Uncharacterized protein n=1 Tax=Erpetoichthys calabaricus TaxID=27687 RepID=A0A8C4XCL0_ERPCA